MPFIEQFVGSASSGGIGSEVKQVAGIATGGLMMASAVFKAINTVPEGHEGLRLRFKKASQVRDSRLPWGKQKGQVFKHVRPGAHLTMPFTHGIAYISTQDRNTRLHDFRLDVGCEAHEVQSSIIWGVVPYETPDGQPVDYGEDYNRILYRAYRGAETQDQMIQNIADICVGGLRRLMNGHDNPRFADPTELGTQLQAGYDEELFGLYGIGIRRLNLLNIARTDAEVLGDKLARAQVALDVATAAIPKVVDLHGIQVSA